VRLAGGLDAEGRLGGEARERALACLARFGQRLQDMPAGTVRAVGTNTLRRARNAREFLQSAGEVLGHPIEVIAGAEEARLVYLGVAQDLHADRGRRLVIDVGGGSTELVVGEGYDVLEASSLYMGCVSYSRTFFSEGRISSKGLERAVLSARMELEPLERRYRALDWEEAIGTSGTVLAIEGILRAQGWARRGVTREGLGKLREAVLGVKRVQDLRLPGLSATRAPVLAGGLAIVLAAFDALGLDALRTSTWALREGLLHDLIGRFGEDDARDRTIEGFARRYHVDLAQADRVERTAAACLAQVADAWGLKDEIAGKLLGWAARLHEMGLTIAHAGYHRHGAYLVAHSDMPGFSRQDQAVLAALIGCHRRKLARELLPPPPAPLKAKATLRLLSLLRLSVLLNRSRSHDPLPSFRLEARKSTLRLGFPPGWLDERPLTRADLDEEAHRLGSAGLTLEVE
jgi:exopolyphosphatase/guanosine-5'-triphosphate,3'-diphosphate pyrophosphatase